MHSYFALCVLSLIGSYETCILLLRKNNTTILKTIKPPSAYFILKSNYSICVHYGPTDISVARYSLPLCNAIPIDYQRIYMRCILSLQCPKTQCMLNPLVGVLATPIWMYRYRFMRCCRGGPVVVGVKWIENLAGIMEFVYVLVKRLGHQSKPCIIHGGNLQHTLSGHSTTHLKIES
jgi:hypothetical protein